MTRMKDSGIEWIGEVPEEWGITKIKFITQLNGRIGWQGLTSAEYKEEGPYLITGTDFLDGKINFETAVHIDEKRWFEAKQIQVENGDLLITKDGTVGKVAIIEGLNEKASLNSGVLRIQTTKNISRRFLFYVLKSDVFWLWFNYTNSGASTILHLYQNVFDEFSFTFPNISEQTQIADFLDKKVAQLDKVKSLLEEQIKTLEDYRQSLIYETVTKGLDKTVPLKDSGVDWIGQIPEGWGITKIKFTTQLNGRIGWQGLTSAEYKEEGPYLITGTDFLDGKINFETAVHIDEKRWFEAKQIQVENGDLLITKDGTVGKVAIIEGLNERASLNSGVLRIQTTENISRRFLFYVLKSDVFWLWFNYTNSGASTILHLYQNVFDEFSFTLPNVSEQNQIIDFLDKKTEQINQMIAIKKEQIENINKQRQTLIYDVVTGKRRV
ncbi:restriction endonuclease subunit S [Streptococcus parasuis]|uniref:restriction endonuclease subunit S n=1 Tax=Streptococcus parasuis TaxID=1501662 RepID=UPI002412AB0D|nr:restriction endonuclease subunit S [Streptococcus parasuis]MDG4477358.1 restriction endonuclease subunit S [Streptococcus parasuis]